MPHRSPHYHLSVCWMHLKGVFGEELPWWRSIPWQVPLVRHVRNCWRTRSLHDHQIAIAKSDLRKKVQRPKEGKPERQKIAEKPRKRWTESIIKYGASLFELGSRRWISKNWEFWGQYILKLHVLHLQFLVSHFPLLTSSYLLLKSRDSVLLFVSIKMVMIFDYFIDFSMVYKHAEVYKKHELSSLERDPGPRVLWLRSSYYLWWYFFSVSSCPALVWVTSLLL